MLKSVNFLLSFRELSGHNQEPLEIRGNQEQLQLLSETVTHYVQDRLGQSLAAAPNPPATAMADELASADTPEAVAAQPYLRPRSLVTHDLVLGPLSTNAENQTVSLKATQLFDLVSALDDCAAELEVLPLSATPSRRPAIPVWASSAAVIVLLLGVSTATFQLTQQNPATQREWVTASDQDANAPSATEGIAAAPQDSTATAPSANPQPAYTPPRETPTAAEAKRNEARRNDLETTAPPKPASPPIVASAPKQETLAPPVPAKPVNNGSLKNQPAAPAPKDKVLADQRQKTQRARQSTSKQLQEPVAVVPPSADAEFARPAFSPPAEAPQPAAEPAPPTADSSIAASELEADQLNGHRGQQRSLNSLGRQAPSMAESASVSPQTAHLQNIRQYLSQRWQVPTGLTQLLQYQLTLNANGSLKRVQPLDPAATQYLDQVPLPAVNQPFIAPLQPSQSPQVRLILKPDGVVQLWEGGPEDQGP